MKRFYFIMYTKFRENNLKLSKQTEEANRERKEKKKKDEKLSLDFMSNDYNARWRERKDMK